MTDLLTLVARLLAVFLLVLSGPAAFLPDAAVPGGAAGAVLQGLALAAAGLLLVGFATRAVAGALGASGVAVMVVSPWDLTSASATMPLAFTALFTAALLFVVALGGGGLSADEWLREPPRNLKAPRVS